VLNFKVLNSRDRGNSIKNLIKGIKNTIAIPIPTADHCPSTPNKEAPKYANTKA